MSFRNHSLPVSSACPSISPSAEPPPLMTSNRAYIGLLISHCSLCVAELQSSSLFRCRDSSSAAVAVVLRPASPPSLKSAYSIRNFIITSGTDIGGNQAGVDYNLLGMLMRRYRTVVCCGPVSCQWCALGLAVFPNQPTSQ